MIFAEVGKPAAGLLMIRHCRQAYPRSGVAPARRTDGAPPGDGRDQQRASLGERGEPVLAW